MLLWLGLFFALGCLAIWLALFDEARDRLIEALARWLPALSGRAAAAVRRGGSRVGRARGHVDAGLRSGTVSVFRHRWLILVTVVALALPALLVLSLRKNVRMEGFSEYDMAPSNSMVAVLLRGERLVPPPPPPVEVFQTAEIRREHPEIVSADRRWQQIHPDLQQRVLAIFRVMKEQHGYEMVLVEGYRSPERQAELMRRGVATRAGAWQSCHQYGLALDSAPMRNGKLQWDMNDPWTRRAYFLYGELAKQAGLEWGGDWRSIKDYVHVEMRDACRAARRARRAAQD